MAQIKIRQVADDNERFASGAFASQIGKSLSVYDRDEGQRTGILMAADVAPDGCSVELAIEVEICANCERCTWNAGPDCGKPEHPHCPTCGHCQGRHA